MQKKGGKRLLVVLRDNWKIAVVVMILTTLTGYILSAYVIKKHYSATVDVYVESTDSESSSEKAATAALLFSSPKMYNALNEALNVRRSYAQYEKMITLEHFSESQLIRATFECDTSLDTYNLADMFTRLMKPVIDDYEANAVLSIVTPATEPQEPDFPDDRLFAIVGAIIGFIISTIGIIIIWRLDDTITEIDNLPDEYNVFVLGELMDFDNEIDYLGR